MKIFFKDGLFMVQEKTMIITGSSKLSISPDITRLSFGIKTQETCYEQTLSYLSDNAESLINVLTLNNFLEKEIKTTRYSIHRWTKYENGQEHHLGYEGEHHLFVEFKIDNERINKIIDEVSTKVPCVSINISYSCSHLEKYDKKLIELAIKDAKSKATIIANPTAEAITYTLSGTWYLLVDGVAVTLDNPAETTGQITIPAYSAVVVVNQKA